MENKLIQKFNLFNSENYYQGLEEAVDELINLFTSESLRNNENNLHQSRVKELKEIIFKNSGLNINSPVPLNPDQEFFTDTMPDQNKIKNFKKQIILNNALQQFKWTFAGTSSSFTKISEKELNQQNKSLNDLLPSELQKNSRNRPEIKKLTSQKKNNSAFCVFAFPDGTISSSYNKNKAVFSFNRTRDRSGVKWDSGYHPDLEVDKSNWKAGFNSKDEWVYIPATEEHLNSDSTRQVSPVEISAESQMNSDIEFISFIDMNDESGVLIDMNGYLIDEHEEQYFDATGSLYASRKSDINKTVQNLKNELKNSKIKHFTSVIIPDTSKKTVSIYKEALGTYITANTEFYSSADNIENETDSANKLKAEKKALSEITHRVNILKTEGYRESELTQALEHESTSPNIERELSIFMNEEDMFTFISLPSIAETINEKTITMLQNMEVPEEMAVPVSNSVQNLIHNYDTLFRHTSLTPEDVITQIQQVLIKNNTEKASQIHIPGETTLAEFITQQSAETRKTTVPVFNSVKKNNFNIFNDREFNAWTVENAKFISTETADQIHRIIISSGTGRNKQEEVSTRFTTVFSEFSSIQESTGITPVELADIIFSSENSKAAKIGGKRILFDKTLDKLIIESSTGNKHLIAVQKSSLFRTEHNMPAVNILDEKQFSAFLTTPEFASYSLLPDEAHELSSELKQLQIPENRQAEFCTNLLKDLPEFKQLSSKGLNIKKIIRANESIILNSKNKDAVLIENITGKKQLNSDMVFTAGNVQELRENVLRELKAANIPETDAVKVISQYRDIFSDTGRSYSLQKVSPVYTNLPFSEEQTISGISSIFNLDLKKITKQGKPPAFIKLQPPSQKMFAQRPFQGRAAHSGSFIPGINSETSELPGMQAPYPAAGMPNVRTIDSAEMLFTFPAVKAAGRTSFVHGKSAFNVRGAETMPDWQQTRPMHSSFADSTAYNETHVPQHAPKSEEEALARFNRNYEADRGMLASSGGGSSNGGGKSAPVNDTKAKNMTIEDLANMLLEKTEKE